MANVSLASIHKTVQGLVSQVAFLNRRVAELPEEAQVRSIAGSAARQEVALLLLQQAHCANWKPPSEPDGDAEWRGGGREHDELTERAVLRLQDLWRQAGATLAPPSQNNFPVGPAEPQPAVGATPAPPAPPPPPAPPMEPPPLPNLPDMEALLAGVQQTSHLELPPPQPSRVVGRSQPRGGLPAVDLPPPVPRRSDGTLGEPNVGLTSPELPPPQPSRVAGRPQPRGGQPAVDLPPPVTRRSDVTQGEPSVGLPTPELPPPQPCRVAGRPQSRGGPPAVDLPPPVPRPSEWTMGEATVGLPMPELPPPQPSRGDGRVHMASQPTPMVEHGALPKQAATSGAQSFVTPRQKGVLPSVCDTLGDEYHDAQSDDAAARYAEDPEAGGETTSLGDIFASPASASGQQDSVPHGQEQPLTSSGDIQADHGLEAAASLPVSSFPQDSPVVLQAPAPKRSVAKKPTARRAVRPPMQAAEVAASADTTPRMQASPPSTQDQPARSSHEAYAAVLDDSPGVSTTVADTGAQSAVPTEVAHGADEARRSQEAAQGADMDGQSLLRVFDCIAYMDEAAALERLSEVPSLSQAPRDDATGRSLLHCAALAGLPSVCTALLARPDFEDANALDDGGGTALHIAATTGHAEVCSVLLRHRRFQSVNTQDGSGFTALHYAAGGDHVEICRMLLHHPDFNAFDALSNLGHTATEMAIGDALCLLRTYALRSSMRKGTSSATFPAARSGTSGAARS